MWVFRLPVCQLRLPGFCNSESLLGVFEGRGSAGPEVAAMLARCVPRLLLEERTIPETASEFMKYTLLSAHRYYTSSYISFQILRLLLKKNYNSIDLQGILLWLAIF